MFRFDDDFTFRAPIVLHLAGDREVAFTGHFRLIPRPEYDALLRADQELDDFELCKRLLCGWDDVEDDGQPVPFDDAALHAAVSQFEGFAHAVLVTCRRARDEAVLKNYAPPAPPGREPSGVAPAAADTAA